MVLPGHLAGGYLATRALLAIFHPGFSSNEIDSLLIVGTLAGELPDIDLVKLYFDGKGDHRTYITHTPSFWLAISLIVIAIGFSIGSPLTKWIGYLVLAGSWSHLLLDSIEYGVRWLWPFSKDLYALKKETLEARDILARKVTARPGSLTNHFQYIIKVYMKTISFWVEIILTLAALYLVC